MSAEKDAELKAAAAELHRAAGNHWAKFITAFKAVETDAAAQLVRAPQDQLARAQGRAQMVRDLSVLLDEA